MGKKKGKKSGKKKDGEADPKKQEMIKRLNTGYTKRLEKYHSQEPLPNVAAILKVAVKAAGEIPQLIFTSADLKGPHGSSRLLPLFEALKETGYPALREVFFWNTLIENNDVLVLANYLEKKQPDQNLTAVEFLDNAFTPFGKAGLLLMMAVLVSSLYPHPFCVVLLACTLLAPVLLDSVVFFFWTALLLV